MERRTCLWNRFFNVRKLSTIDYSRRQTLPSQYLHD